MRYRIEYADGRCCNFANSRKDLLDWLKALKDEKIVDIRKVYKNGVTDSVIASVYKPDNCTTGGHVRHMAVRNCISYTVRDYLYHSYIGVWIRAGNRHRDD